MGQEHGDERPDAVCREIDWVSLAMGGECPLQDLDQPTEEGGADKSDAGRPEVRGVKGKAGAKDQKRHHTQGCRMLKLVPSQGALHLGGGKE